MTKFVFVTGGVVSSLGKGIAAASLAAILASRGVRVTKLKLDPYINVDPGTMWPFQHGEVFVTDDGAETDLDLGHYERFTDVRDGQAQQLHHRPDLRERDPQGAPRRLPRRHRAGDPAHHRRDQGVHRARRRRRHADEAEVAIVEVGGTVGDIESLPFLEAIRQMGIELGRDNVCYIHLTLVPFIPSAGEMKTKPTQHSVKELREIGIQPDVVLCRADRPMPDGDRRKIALFTNVPPEAVIPALDVDSIYKIPRHAARRGARRHRLQEAARSSAPPADLTVWDELVDALEHPASEVHIAMVGKYVDLTESYKSLSEALIHAGIHTRAQVSIHYIDSRSDRARGRRVRCAAWTRSWCRAASASAASRARSRRSATRARTASRISASASACSSR